MDHLYRGSIVKEREAFVEEYEHFKTEQRYGARSIFLGILIFFVGAYSLMIPLYKVICEGFGYSTKTSHQEYSFDPNKVDVHRKWRVHF